MPSPPLRAALGGLVDYAGLFPPASLDLAGVVARFASYARSPDRWMLGRLIVPLANLGALASLAASRPQPALPGWPVSALVPAGAALDEVGPALRTFDAANAARGLTVVAVEHAVTSPADIQRFARAVTAEFERYVEVPLDGDLPALLDAVAAADCLAKVRTGGVTAERFPSPETLAAFLEAAAARGLAFKATAGLHHPLRNRYRLTYEPGSPQGEMHGFVNLVLAAALAAAGARADRRTLRAVLEETDPGAFTVRGDGIAWREIAMTTADLEEGRRHGLRSVGSCSFDEPVDELRTLGWLVD